MKTPVLESLFNKATGFNLELTRLFKSKSYEQH